MIDKDNILKPAKMKKLYDKDSLIKKITDGAYEKYQKEVKIEKDKISKEEFLKKYRDRILYHAYIFVDSYLSGVLEEMEKAHKNHKAEQQKPKIILPGEDK
ncbi:MAG: hypothetical protein ACOCT9_01400 [archaeon]